MAILCRKPQPQAAALGQTQPDRTLNLRQKRLDRGFEIDDFVPGQQITRNNLGTGMPWLRKV